MERNILVTTAVIMCLKPMFLLQYQNKKLTSIPVYNVDDVLLYDTKVKPGEIDIIQYKFPCLKATIFHCDDKCHLNTKLIHSE